MRIETPGQSIQIEDIPVPEKITQIVVNLPEQTVEITYQGHPALVYQSPTASVDSASWTADQ